MPKAKDKIPLIRPDPPPAAAPTPPEAAPISPPVPPEAPRAEATPPPTTAEGVGIDQFMVSMGFQDAPPPVPAVVEPPKDENAPEGKPEGKDEPSAEIPPPPEPAKKGKDDKKPDVTPPVEDDEDKEKPELDFDAIRQTVREAVTSVVKPDPAKPADAPTGQPVLSPSRRETLDTAKFMEDTMDEYRGSGLQGQLQRYWQAEDKHKHEWLKDNPGRRYRSDDEEHTPFYDTNPMPDYSPDDFADAQALRRQKAENDLKDSHRQELDRLRFETEAKQHEQEIKATGNKAASELYVNAPDNVKTALTVDGKLVINRETLAKLEVEEPVFAERLKHHAEIVGTMVEELERLSRFPEHVRVNPENPVHSHILTFADSLERHMLTRPKAETMREGKAFVAQADYMARAEAIQGSTVPHAQKKAQLQTLSDKFYFADAQVIRENLIRSATHRALQEAEEIETRLAKSPKYARPATSNGAPASASNGAATPPAKTGDGRNVRPPSPSVETVARTNAAGSDPENIKSQQEAIDRAMGWA